MRVRCERDGTEFEVTPRAYPSEEHPFSKKDCEENGYAHPCQVIDCITCCRGYFLDSDGVWRSDRPLTILG